MFKKIKSLFLFPFVLYIAYVRYFEITSNVYVEISYLLSRIKHRELDICKGIDVYLNQSSIDNYCLLLREIKYLYPIEVLRDFNMYGFDYQDFLKYSNDRIGYNYDK